MCCEMKASFEMILLITLHYRTYILIYHNNISAEIIRISYLCTVLVFLSVKMCNLNIIMHELQHTFIFTFIINSLKMLLQESATLIKMKTEKMLMLI